MLTLEQHFAAGYLPALAAAWFNASLLVSEYADAPTEALQDALRDVGLRLRSSRGRVREDLRLVAALAELAGFAAAAVPGDSDAFFAWSRVVHQGFEARLTTWRRGELAFRLGAAVGDALATWTLARETVRLLRADPSSQVFGAQLGALREDLLDIRDDALEAGHAPESPAVLAALCDQLSDVVDELSGLPGEGASALVLAGVERLLDGRLVELHADVARAREVLREEDNTGEA